MNRKLLVATVTASALALGGGTVAFASGDGPDAPADRGSAATASVQDDDARALKGAEVSAQEALDKALAEVEGGKVESLELDDRKVWEADVLGTDGTWHDVTVDAASGKVTAQVDKDGADDRDDRDDKDDKDDDRNDRDDKDDDRDDRGDKDDDRDDRNDKDDDRNDRDDD
jgi:hypothetical protein